MRYRIIALPVPWKVILQFNVKQSSSLDVLNRIILEDSHVDILRRR